MIRLYRAIKIGICLWLLNSCIQQAFAAEETYPTQSIRFIKHPDSHRNKYIENLIVRALFHSQKTADISYIEEKVTFKRIAELLMLGKDINIAWKTATDDWNKKLRPIPVPLYMGIHGKRVLLVNAKAAKRISEITELNQLNDFVGVQHKSWFDYEVLTGNGLNINGELDYSQMFKAIQQGLADYFPRSAYVVALENNRFAHKNILIEPNILLQYPAYVYFYTNKDNEELADRIHSGLLKMQGNGEHQALFERHTQLRLKGLNLNTRRVFKLQ